MTGDADDARAQARSKFAAGDFVQAASLFAEHASQCRDPKDASKARADEAAAWLSAGVAEPANRRAHAEKALEATQAALALDPTHVRARLRLGKVYVLLGDLDKAREALSSLADHPDASVARDARKAHARLSPQRNPMGSPPSTRTRSCASRSRCDRYSIGAAMCGFPPLDRCVCPDCSYKNNLFP